MATVRRMDMPSGSSNAVGQKRNGPALVLQWAEGALPLRAVQVPPTKNPRWSIQVPPPWWETGPVELPFDFCGHIRRLTDDIAQHCEALSHIDVTRILFAFTQARNARTHGLQARVTPLRFRDGQLVRRHRGVDFQVQRYFIGQREILYVVTFCLPRFLNLDFDEKMVTLFHELYHISPLFNGDLRRHEGRYTLHSSSQKRYDEAMAHYARAYLAQRNTSPLHHFLRLNFSQLVHRHGSVVGVMVPRPKAIPIGPRP